MANGMFWSAVGDHLGADGNAYVYAYDPESHRLTEMVSVLDVVPHEPGEWGFGKIHAQMVTDPCGRIWFATYWGSRRGLQYTKTYQGDRLLVIDPVRREVADMGVLLRHHGVPSLAAWGKLLYAEAADPGRTVGGAFVVYDTERREVIFSSDDDAHRGFRSIAVDGDGRAYFSVGNGQLAVYDPQENEIVDTIGGLPGAFLRAAATAPDGTVYAVTRRPEVFFSLGDGAGLRVLSAAAGYTTSLAIASDGRTAYSVPGAHGDAYELGAPLVALDTRTGRQRTVAELEGAVEQELQLRLGGSYDVVLGASDRTLYVGMNASGLSDQSGFGEAVLLVVELP